MNRIPVSILASVTACAWMCGIAWAEDDFTLYELLDPSTSAFAITYDTTAARPGQTLFFNAVRAGSAVADERVIDRATAQDLEWELVSGLAAKANGWLPDRVADDARYLMIRLAAPVPEGGEARLRISKTYTDPASYRGEGDGLVFERALGIRANAVVLPPGYELTGCSVPAIVSTLADGRVKASFLNDRDDALAVRITGRRLAAGGAR